MEQAELSNCFCREEIKEAIGIAKGIAALANVAALLEPNYVEVEEVVEEEVRIEQYVYQIRLD